MFSSQDEPLRAQIRLNVGAFQRATPSEAYLVRWERETTTQDEVNRGIVNVLAGFAPLKPAEYGIIRIQHKAGQT